MKIYIYKDHEVSQFPSFKERPWIPKGEGVSETDNPKDADYIICPAALHKIRSKDMTLRVAQNPSEVETLKYWKEYESKHVFFDCSDWEVSLGGTSATLIRCNVRSFMLTDKNTIPWFWPVDDLKDYMSIPEGGFKYDVSFQGWICSATRYRGSWVPINTRKDAIESCINCFGEKCYYKTFPNFYGDIPKEEQDKRYISFLKNQQETRIMLAPHNIPGVFPYRFYEAMSAARVPALFCTDYHLPFQNEIDWDKCTLRFDAEQAINAGKLIKDFLSKTSDEQLIEMGKYGREVWEKWLNRDKQPELTAYILKKKLKGT
jgi:hypothetical protein